MLMDASNLKLKKSGVLKNEPIPAYVNSEYVHYFSAYRYGNIVSVYARIKKVDGNTESIVYVSGLPIPEMGVIKSIVTNKGNNFRYHVDAAG